jgi:hypothetical protein
MTAPFIANDCQHSDRHLATPDNWPITIAVQICEMHLACHGNQESTIGVSDFFAGCSKRL